MSDRITYNTNSTEGFPAKVKETTVAYMEAINYSFLGALPIHAMVETMYRVKTFQIDVTCDGDPNGTGQTTYTASATVTAVLSNVLELSSVLNQWGSLDPLFGTTNIWESSGNVILLENASLSPDGFIYYQDENGKFWNATQFIFGIPSNEDAGVNITATNISGFGATFVANPCNLVLAGGTYPLTNFYVGVDSNTTFAELTITATEWWEYETKAGLPAWDSATGLASNEGAVG